MIDLGPPPLLVPPKPAIIQPAGELWNPQKATLPGMSGIAGGAALRAKSPPLDPFAFSFVSANTPGSSFSIGTAPTGANKRFVIAAIGSRGSTGHSVSSVTIGGVSATIVVQTADPSGATPGQVAIAAIAIAEVPTGTTATVSVTFGTTSSFSRVAVYTMTNPASGTAFGSALDDSHVSGELSLNVNTSAGGAVVAVSSQDAGGVVTMTGVTKDAEIDMNTSEYFSAGSASGTAAATPRTILFDGADISPGAMCGVSASWAA